MTDLADSMGPTLTCQECTAQVPVEDAVGNRFRCTSCGAAMTGRPDYAVEGKESVEVVRAYRAYGYSIDFDIRDDGRVECTECHHVDWPEEFDVDTVRGGPDVDPAGDGLVAAARCRNCGAAGTITAGGGVTNTRMGEAEAARRLVGLDLPGTA